MLAVMNWGKKPSLAAAQPWGLWPSLLLKGTEEVATQVDGLQPTSLRTLGVEESTRKERKGQFRQ